MPHVGCSGAKGFNLSFSNAARIFSVCINVDWSLKDTAVKESMGRSLNMVLKRHCYEGKCGTFIEYGLEKTLL